MIAAVVLAVVAGHSLAATWAVRHRGPRGLWGTTLTALGVLGLLVTAAGLWYAVPDRTRLFVYALGFFGPIVLGGTLAVIGVPRGGAFGPTLGRAVAGAAGGLVAGWALVVFGFRGW